MVTLVSECRRVALVISSWYLKCAVLKIRLNQPHQTVVRMYGVVIVSLNYISKEDVPT